jgi:molybdopterin biosynthesis enzyme MoaB
VCTTTPPGPLIVEALEALGFDVTGPKVVSDGEPVGQAIRLAVSAGARLVVTTGRHRSHPHRPDP